MKYPQARVVVMSKAPVAGRVKTRLIPLLGATGAAVLYRRLLGETLAGLCNAALCPVQLCCAPDRRHACFTRAARNFPIELAEQTHGDLGRLSHAATAALRQADRVVVVGADCPDMTPADVDLALERLAAGADVVLGPSRDGGYYLIGMRQPQPALFESIAWGSAAVLASTRQRLDTLGLSYRLLPERTDIDRPADYLAWQAARMQGMLDGLSGRYRADWRSGRNWSIQILE